MKKSFVFITNMTEQQLQEIMQGQHFDTLIDPLIQQLIDDFQVHIFDGEYDPLKQANNYIAKVAELDHDDPYLQERTLEKLEILNEYLSSYKNPDDEVLQGHAHQSALILVEMFQALHSLLTTTKIKNIITNYKNHLENALRGEGIRVGINGTFALDYDEEKLSTEVRYLCKRYEIISDLYAHIKDAAVLNAQKLDDTKNVFLECLRLKPRWEEKPFLEQLQAVLSVICTIGITLLYKAFTSPEHKASEEMQTHFPDTNP